MRLSWPNGTAPGWNVRGEAGLPHAPARSLGALALPLQGLDHALAGSAGAVQAGPVGPIASEELQLDEEQLVEPVAGRLALQPALAGDSGAVAGANDPLLLGGQLGGSPFEGTSHGLLG